MAEIAADVGVGASALYRHFPTKQALLRAACFDSIESVGRIGAAATLDDVFATAARPAVRDRFAAVLWQREARLLSPEDRHALRTQLVTSASRIAGLVATTRPELSEDDALLLAWAVISVFGSTGMHRSTLPTSEFERFLTALANNVCHTVWSADTDGYLHDSPTTASTDDAVTVGAVSSSTREAMLSAAIGMFAERGYPAVSTDDIGGAVGTSGPNVYKHFDSKTDILVAIAARAGDRRSTATAAALAGVHAPGERLTRLLAAHVDFAIGQRRLMDVLTGELHNLPPGPRRAATQGQREYLRLWARTLVVARPELTERQARIVVPAALAIVDDAARNGRLNQRRDLSQRLTDVATAVLLGDD